MSDSKRASSSKTTTNTASTNSKLRQVSSAKITFNTDTTTMNLLNKEEEYKRLNAELEKKTATLVYEAEQVLKANEKLINETDYLDRITDINFLNNETIKKQTREKTQHSLIDLNELAHFKQTINNLEDNQLDEDDYHSTEQTEETTPTDRQLFPKSANDMSSDAQIRFLKAKLKVMQEELDRFQFELNKKEEESLKLAQRCKELDEDRAKQLRISNSHQTQMDKYKKQAEDTQLKLNAQDLQLQSLKKENDQLKKETKKQQIDQQQVDLRLNRALEEIEKYKQQLAKTQISSKDVNEQEKRRIEQLQSDNKRLQKQKLELIQAFKKQLKLIDILKKQKMHLEAAKMLQFSEDEFINALEWNNTNTAAVPQSKVAPKGASNRPASGSTVKSNTNRSVLPPQSIKQELQVDTLNHLDDEEEDNEIDETPMYNNVLLDDDDYDEDHD